MLRLCEEFVATSNLCLLREFLDLDPHNPDNRNFTSLVRSIHQVMSLTCPEYIQPSKYRGGHFCAPSIVLFSYILSLSYTKEYGTPTRCYIDQDADIDIQLYGLDRCIHTLFILSLRVNILPDKGVVDQLFLRIAYLHMEKIDEMEADCEYLTQDKELNSVCLSVCDTLFTGLYMRLSHISLDVDVSDVDVFDEYIRTAFSDYHMPYLYKQMAMLDDEFMVTDWLRRTYKLRMKTDIEPSPRTVILSVTHDLVQIKVTSINWECPITKDRLFLIALRNLGLSYLVKLNFTLEQRRVYKCGPYWYIHGVDKGFKYLRTAVAHIDTDLTQFHAED